MFQPLDRLPFLDLTGTLRTAHALSLLDRPYFMVLREECLQLSRSADLRLLYDRDRRVAELVNCCLLMSGISPAWVDAEMACRMLFGLGDEPPFLLVLNFPSPPEMPEDKDENLYQRPTDYSVEAWAIASLWSATEDLEQALRIARGEPYSLITEVLRSRSLQLQRLDPKYKERQQLANASDRLKAAMQSGRLTQALKDLSNGTNGSAKPISPNQIP